VAKSFAAAVNTRASTSPPHIPSSAHVSDRDVDRLDVDYIFMHLNGVVLAPVMLRQHDN
jgi:hypothetical protein